jgi:hypothetical protein
MRHGSSSVGRVGTVGALAAALQLVADVFVNLVDLRLVVRQERPT